jgi:uncharacterized DUF497 family protein
MNGDEFEWNAAKADSNLAKHGVSFAAARRVFDDMFALEWTRNSVDAMRDTLLIGGEIHFHGVGYFSEWTQTESRIRSKNSASTGVAFS